MAVNTKLFVMRITKKLIAPFKMLPINNTRYHLNATPICGHINSSGPTTHRRCISATTKMMAYTPDYYTVLGVSRSANLQTIKLAYFRLAKRFHPDTNHSDEARFMFQYIAEAYDVLSDERKRSNYDTHGTAGSTFGGTAGGPQRKTGSASQTYDSEELFLKIFGEADGRDANREYQQEQEYNDMCEDGFDATRDVVVNMSFEEAAQGCIEHVPLNLKIFCVKCKGQKSELGYQSNICPYCEGTGLETEKVGHVLTRKTCSYCDGSKLFNKWKCNECAGTGLMIKAVPDYGISIPPGCENGQVLKFPIDKFYLDHSAPDQPSHFYVKLVVEENSYFKRESHDIYTEADVSVSQALLGGYLSIRGLYSDELKIPLPSDPNLENSHKTLASAGQGIFISESLGYGNHFVEIGVKVPETLTEAQKELALNISIKEDPPQNGAVDNGIEYEDSHRYRINVVEPSNIQRKFNPTRRKEEAYGRTYSKANATKF